MQPHYDAIIAGGSFAGLAAANQLRGKHILLVEPHAIGTVQTSACGTLLAVLQATKTTDSLLQVHDYLMLHLGGKTHEYAIPYSFCTFDYRILCDRLLAQTKAEVLSAAVIGRQGHRVQTTQGMFEADVLIDATGWRAALATEPNRPGKPGIGRSFGLESVIRTRERNLHFYYDKRNLHAYNVGWLFPAGEVSRAGLANYHGATHLKSILDGWVHENWNATVEGMHGGYFPYRRRPATSGDVFRIGDAAGQCIPLTGEGIRPALYFGTIAGHLARRALDGEIRPIDALYEYRKCVERHADPYRYLYLVQKILPGLPMAWIALLAGRIQRPDVLDPLLGWYWKALDPNIISQYWVDGPPNLDRDGDICKGGIRKAVDSSSVA